MTRKQREVPGTDLNRVQHARLICILCFLAFVTVVMGCFGSSGSSVFILGFPLSCYLAARTNLLPWTSGKLLGLSIVFLMIPLVLVLPPVRQHVASHYIARSLAMARANLGAEAEFNRMRAWQWDARSTEAAFERERRLDEWARSARGKEDVRTQVNALYEQARRLAKNGQTQEESALYKRILELDSTHPEANYCLAMHYDTVQANRNLALHHLRIAHDNLPEGSLWKQRCKEIMSKLMEKNQ